MAAKTILTVLFLISLGVVVILGLRALPQRGDVDTGARDEILVTTAALPPGALLRANDHGEGDKDDKHGIFGGGGTTLVNAKAIDQTEHFKFLLPMRPGPIASVR